MRCCKITEFLRLLHDIPPKGGWLYRLPAGALDRVQVFGRPTRTTGRPTNRAPSWKQRRGHLEQAGIRTPLALVWRRAGPAWIGHLTEDIGPKQHDCPH